ncbi:MAG: isopentenyl-diphosphate delta-isomerase [Bacteriovoracaceae bacterium]
METRKNLSLSAELAQRKGSHIELTPLSQTNGDAIDSRFHYEPLFFAHPKPDEKWEATFLSHSLDYPIWISSMTGGTQKAALINKNLSTLAGKYKLGMGLGSCRPLLHSRDRLSEFAVRDFLGDQPLLANLGIAQIEECVLTGKTDLIHEVVKMTEASGLMIHLNPLQEWLQPEGDRYTISPLETIKRFLDDVNYPVLVKEVGQGMGPKSLKALLNLPLHGIEFGAFGGTNFTKLESLRASNTETKLPFIHVGHTAHEMVDVLNALPVGKKEFIISGGVKNVLDGYELKMKLKAPSLIGMASPFLGPAMESFESLENYFLNMREALLTARGLLSVKGEQ